jgi:hypothetical protein
VAAAHDCSLPETRYGMSKRTASPRLWPVEAWCILCTIDSVLGMLSPLEIEQLLSGEMIARLGCHADGRTYVVPVTYAYDGEALIIQSADGMKVRMMHQNPVVCVEVDHVDDLANWRSVIAWGLFEELFGNDATAALTRLRDRLQPFVASQTTPMKPGPWRDGEKPVRRGNGHASVYRIRLLEKTGRFERQGSAASPGEPA